jgi:enoyl-CoA hydratase
MNQRSDGTSPNHARMARKIEYETDEPVLYESRDSVAVITLNRPRYANALNNQMSFALDDGLRRAVEDNAIGVIVVRGAGKHFTSGHDMGSPGNDFANFPNERRACWYDYRDKDGAEMMYSREQELYLGFCRSWRALPKPIIAAVQGACIAGGLALAWVCDLIIAADDAYFADPVLAMGLPGIEYFVHPHELPNRIAREFLYLGERMTAQRAYEVGMVNRVVPHEKLFEEALAMAAKIATKPRFALALAKQACNLAEDLQGKRNLTESVFAMHHVAHAHNELVHGQSSLNQDTGAIRRLIK